MGSKTGDMGTFERLADKFELLSEDRQDIIIEGLKDIIMALSDREVPLESDIEQTCCRLAERAGWEVRKLKWIGRKAAMDRAFIGHRRFVLVEFKRPGEELRKLQLREFQRLRTKYSDVWAVWDIDTFRAILKIPEHIQ